ncbi:hypothetical protein [Kiloniella majae]|uniref:hypothetical protein n=1 Tax=Kiloniella majae TaxID=1938558 RepID=UPI00130264A7|nr:hypothetical protein [Kiloniella majae]
MRSLKKGQTSILQIQSGVMGGVSLIESAFSIGRNALSEVISFYRDGTDRLAA